ncbi:unnamed protein product, partial [Ectocarpus fasciculatus]
EASDVSSTDGDAGVDEGETRPRRSWLPWRRYRPADVDEGPVTNLAPAGDDAALADPDLSEDAVDVDDGLTGGVLEQAVLSLAESVLLASESITNGGEDVSTGEAGDASDGDGPDAVPSDTDPTSHVNMEEGDTSDLTDLPRQDVVLPGESAHTEEGSAGGDGAWGGEDAQDEDVATITDEDVFADVGSQGDVVLGDDPEVEAGGVTSMADDLARGDDDASSVAPAVETNPNDLATPGGVSTAELGTLPGGDDVVDDSGLADDAVVAVVAEDAEASALSNGDDEASGVSITDGDAGVDEGETRPRRAWLPWRRHRPVDIDEDPVKNVAPAVGDADLAGPDLLEDMVDVGDGDDAALEQGESTSSSLPESSLLASESGTNVESSPDGTDAPDGGGGGGGVKAGASELNGDHAAEYADDAVPPADTGGVNDRHGPKAVIGDIGPGGGYETGPDGLGESSGVEMAATHLGDAGTSGMADPQGQDGALPEESSHMEEGSVGGDETGSLEDDQDGVVAMIPDEDDFADVGSESHAVLGDDPEGGTGSVTSIEAGLAGSGNDVSSVSSAVETETDDSSTSGSDGISTAPIDAEVGALVDGQDDTADSGSADDVVIAGAAGDGEASALSIGDDEASDVSSTDGDAGVDEGETRPRRSWLPWRRHRPADVDEGPVTNLAPAGDDAALADLDTPDDAVDVVGGDDAALEQAVLSLAESVLLSSESTTNGGEDVSTGEAGDVSDGDGPDAVTSDTDPTSHVNLEEGGTGDVADLPEQHTVPPEEGYHMEEGAGGGDGAEDAKAGHATTTTDEDDFADVDSEGNIVLGDDPEDGGGGVTSIEADLAGGEDDASGVPPAVETNADDPASSGSDYDTAISTAKVCALRGGYYDTANSDSNAGGMCVLSTAGDASAVSMGDDEASGVSSKDSDAGDDEGETRPRRSWLRWRRHQPADVDEDPVTNLIPAGDDADVAGPGAPEDVVDVGDDLPAAALEQAVVSFVESVLLASQSITNGGEGVSTGEAGDVSDGDDPNVGTGDTGPSSHVNLEEGGSTTDMADPPRQDGALHEEISHMEVAGRGDGARGGEDARAGHATTTTDEDDFADVGSESDIVLGDDPEGGAGGVTSMGDGLTGDGDDASSVAPAVEMNADGPLTSGGDDDSAVSVGEDEASGVSPTVGDVGAPVGETRPHRSWLPWRRPRPADVDEDPVTNLTPAGDDADLADPDVPEGVIDVDDDLTAALLEQAVSIPLRLAESVLLAPESTTNGGEDISTGEAGDASNGDGRDALTGDIGPDPLGSDGGGGGVGDGLDGLGEGTSVEAMTTHLEEGGTGDMVDLPEKHMVPPEEGYEEEGAGGGDRTRSDEDVEAGDVATTTDGDESADVGSEGGAVLGDDAEGGAGGVASMEADLAEAGDDASSVSSAVETTDDDPASPGGDGDSAVSTAEVGDLPDGHDVTGYSDSNDDAVGVSATGGEVSAVFTSDDEASDVSSKDGDAGVDEGETRPRRSWLPWRRYQPADVDEDPVTNLTPAGDDIALADSDIPEDVVGGGDGGDAALEEAVSTPPSLPESMLASESITNGGEDVSSVEVGDASDGDDRDAVTGDIGPDPRASTGGGGVADGLDDMGESTSVEAVTARSDEGASDMTDPPGQDGELAEESYHTEEAAGADAHDEDVATITDEDKFADAGSESDVVLGDDPEGGAGGATSMGAGFAAGDDDPASSDGDGDSAFSTAEVGDLPDGHDATGDSDSNDDAIGVLATGGEASAVSTGDDEASGVSSKEDGDAGAGEGETRPGRSWLPWRRHRPADVDEDPVPNLAPAGDDAALAGPDTPEDVVDVGDDLPAAGLEQAVLGLAESALLASESTTNGDQDVSSGEAGDVSDGDDPEAMTGDIGPDPHVNLEEGRDTNDMVDPPGQDSALHEEIDHMEEGSVGEDEARGGEDAKAGDVATITDEDGFADAGSEDDVVLVDDPEGGEGAVTSVEAGLAGSDDDASSSVSPAVETNADDSSASGSDGDSAGSIDAEGSALVGGQDDAADSGSADGAVGAEGGEASAVSSGDHEASDVSSQDGDADVPRRSWLPWRRHRPADVEDNPETSLAPAGDDADLVGSDLAEHVVDVGDGDDAALEQAESTPLGLPEKVLSASEGSNSGGEDASTGEAGDVSDGDDRDAVTGDTGPDPRASTGAGSTGDGLDDSGEDDLGESASVEAVAALLEASGLTDPPGQDGYLPEESAHTEEGSGAGHGAGSREDDAKAGDMTAVTDEDVVGSEGDVVLGDDPDGVSDDAGIHDDDDATVVPVDGILDASGAPDGDAHALAEDPPTARRPGETDAAARLRSRSPTKLAPPDDVATFSQAAAAAEDVLELAATAVPVVAAGVGGAAAGSAPRGSWFRPKALRRLFKFGRAPRGGEGGSHEEESPRTTTSSAGGAGAGTPAQSETPTEGAS